MAHFARLNSENKVETVIVVNNDVLLDENGEEQESLGLDFIASLGLDGVWVQCSYNGTFRAHYPGTGFHYDEERDAFIPPQPFDSWVLNDATVVWEAPVAYPENGEEYGWDEAAGDWVEVTGA